MRFFKLASTLLISGLAIAAPARETSTTHPGELDEWTVSNTQMQRQDNNTKCSWKLDITTKSKGATYACAFDVLSFTDCGTADFPQGGVYCNNTGEWLVNAGHNADGFYVMVLVNTVRVQEATYGWEDGALGQSIYTPVGNQTRPVYKWGTLGTAHSGRDLQHVSERQNGVALPAPQWSVGTVYRVLDTGASKISMQFHVVDRNVTTPCTLDLQAPAGTDLKTWSFYYEQCQNEGSTYWISWGYNTNPDEIKFDSATMTVISPDHSMMAWFAWRWVNENQYLAPLGPNTVQFCSSSGC